MARKKLRLNGFDIFLFAVSNKEVQSYKDLHMMYVQSKEFSKLCANQGLDGDNILSFTTLCPPTHKKNRVCLTRGQEKCYNNS